MPVLVGVLVGIALLLILAFAVSYAAGSSAGGAGRRRRVGRRARAGAQGAAHHRGIARHRRDPADLRPQRALRQAEAFERQRDTSVERGAHVFAQYCYACHGYTGTGAIVPGQGIQAANLTIRRATGDRDDDRKTYDLLTKTIARGRPNTPMPGLGPARRWLAERRGDPELATFIMYGNWNEVQALVAPGAPTPEHARRPQRDRRRAARSLFSSKGCVACHTIQEIPTARGRSAQPDPARNSCGHARPGRERRRLHPQAHSAGVQLPVSLAGFQPLMPPFQGQFTPEQLDALRGVPVQARHLDRRGSRSRRRALVGRRGSFCATTDGQRDAVRSTSPRREDLAQRAGSLSERALRSGAACRALVSVAALLAAPAVGADFAVERGASGWVRATSPVAAHSAARGPARPGGAPRGCAPRLISEYVFCSCTIRFSRRLNSTTPARTGVRVSRWPSRMRNTGWAGSTRTRRGSAPDSAASCARRRPPGRSARGPSGPGQTARPLRAAPSGGRARAPRDQRVEHGARRDEADARGDIDDGEAHESTIRS